ncbi:MAG TPA: DEAD/DEAH box helicase, partial [Acidiferrobacterales bacterium]
MSEVPPIIVRIAVPSPLRRHFDYRLPRGSAPPPRGARVRVPFGRRALIGLVLGHGEASALPAERLKPIDTVLDATPLLSEELLGFIEWAADYYHHPIGDALHTALPVTLRRGMAAAPRGEEWVSLTAAGRELAPQALARAPRQRAVVAVLAAAPAEGLAMAALAERIPQARSALRTLAAKGRVQVDLHEPAPAAVPAARPGPALTDAQQQAVSTITAALGGFHGFLVHGITGSGKTEVYLRAVDAAVAGGGQALVLVPEIGLTPQLIQRFRERLKAPLVVMHSGLNESERHNAWLAARAGRAAIVLGTRSAVFAPLPRLKLIIVDEEHDGSYKQQDGFRYSAR